MRAVCNVINKVRVAKGWSVLPASEAEVTATVWLEILDSGRVPHEHYDELYRRAMQSRASIIARGDKPPEVTPEFLVGLWSGPNGLAADVAVSRESRLLPETPESLCKACGGTGFRPADRDGYRGVERCLHGGEPKNG